MRYERDGRVLPLVVRVGDVLYEVAAVELVEEATYLPADAIVSRGPVYVVVPARPAGAAPSTR